MRHFLSLLSVPLFCLSGAASAQVYKCTDQSGTVSYTGTPCAKAAISQQLTKIDTQPSSLPAADRDWEKENQEFAQRRQARNANDNAAQNRWNPAARASASNQASQANQGLVAACEKNHGVHCSNPNVIAQMKRENTPITKAEQQQAIGERRARERDEAFNRAAGR